MEIILKQDIPSLGYAGDIVNVKPGYARNFLIPKKMAVLATESNKKIIAENRRQAAHKLAKEKDEALAKAAEIKKVGVTIPVKVGTTGKLFGSITNLMISRALKDKGFEVDRKHIVFLEEVSKIGKFKILVKVHKEVEVEVDLNIVREEEVG